MAKYQILGSESFTRWLVWGTSASAGTRDSASAREPGKIGKFLHSHCLQGHEVQFFNYLVVFECPYHLTLSALLKLHSFLSKTTIHRSQTFRKILGRKAKSYH